ncbi:hypothetical protein AVEN_258025-1 [Araneus ventricosus]|uniref:Uncharacterized protein n=1 Tax=Araneus ventricosus TaxID=182803 RepID=A0A4Y2VSM7_ARAVE|nr:hypothetical protein AVEN_258025-1 [Araneus ventricosus]
MGLEGDLESTVIPKREIYRRKQRKFRFFLARSQHDAGPEKFPLKYELSVIAVDGSPFKPNRRIHIRKGIITEIQISRVRMRYLRGKSSTAYLKELCTYAVGCGCLKVVSKGRKIYCMNSAFELEKIFFFIKWKILKNLKPNEKNTVRSSLIQKQDVLASSSLYFTEKSAVR